MVLPLLENTSKAWLFPSALSEHLSVEDGVTATQNSSTGMILSNRPMQPFHFIVLSHFPSPPQKDPGLC